MKNYIKPTVSVVELQARENIANNPITSVVVDPTSGATTTTYNVAVFGLGSVQPQ